MRPSPGSKCLRWALGRGATTPTPRSGAWQRFGRKPGANAHAHQRRPLFLPGADSPRRYGGYPECWAEIDSKGKVVGCGGFAARATLEWIEAGGRRIDSANSYQNQHAVGQAMALSQVPREEMFFLSKTGPSNPLGYNDTLRQFAAVLTEAGVDYVDALLIHW